VIVVGQPGRWRRRGGGDKVRKSLTVCWPPLVKQPSMFPHPSPNPRQGKGEKEGAEASLALVSYDTEKNPSRRSLPPRPQISLKHPACLPGPVIAFDCDKTQGALRSGIGRKNKREAIDCRLQRGSTIAEYLVIL
jgi:hypothetical protein